MKAMKFLSMAAICIFGSALLLSGCSESVKSSGVYQPGTYTASAEGYGGDVTVEVKFDSDSILSVTILDQNETERVSDRALEEIPERIVEAQTSEVDAITSATVTSDAIKTAVTDCIRQATQE